MFQWLGMFVSRYWMATILLWIVTVVAVRAYAPRWDDVTHDGDFEYMPASMPSVQGEQLLRKAFPKGRSKSEAVVILAREDRPLDLQDLAIVKSLVSRFQNMLGVSLYREAQRLTQEAADLRAAENATEAELLEADDRDAQAKLMRERAVAAFDEAVEQLSEHEDMQRDSFFALPSHNLALMYREENTNPEDAEYLQSVAWAVEPRLKEQPAELSSNDGELPLIDVWSRYTDRFGSSLISKDKQADLIFLRLSNEFMAADNIPLIKKIEETLEQTKAALVDWPEGLELGLSGSAAVGSDMLRSAKESIQNTEMYTVLLVIGILLVVYRSPALIAVPLVTIVVSLLVATSLVASLTTLGQLDGFQWWNFKIFTTTKIFVVVILFGAGTDYCLFLISRYKEELALGKPRDQALSDSLAGVGEALAASAFTTIIGLGTMYFAQFGKFRNSGPTIGLCLFVTLLACVTLAPALLRAIGGMVHWRLPLVGRLAGGSNEQATGSAGEAADSSGFWPRVADLILARPWAILTGCTLVMLPFFFLGFNVSITYDLISELGDNVSSKKGAALLRRHFDVGQSGPIVVLAHKQNGDFDSAEGIQAIRDLTNSMYLEGIESVRSLVAPVGGKPKGGTAGLLAQNHRITREIYLSKEPALDGDVARLELVMGHDPFSLDAIQVLEDVSDRLDEMSATAGSYWDGAEFVFTGTTAAIRDLRQVTTSDNTRIQRLVVLAVLIILLILLKRPAVCIYLILSVLFSYYATIGATELWFQSAYGDTYEGLDWKVPLFLFVILVAIGQDYNIYLATRVFEEQKEHGMFGGLRQAIVQTGGIITSCGVIMAGTFLSMMTGSLRGIAELGFALTLGVLIDTFVVRPILVPAFLAILFQWHSSKKPVAA